MRFWRSLLVCWRIVNAYNTCAIIVNQIKYMWYQRWYKWYHCYLHIWYLLVWCICYSCYYMCMWFRLIHVIYALIHVIPFLNKHVISTCIYIDTCNIHARPRDIHVDAVGQGWLRTFFFIGDPPNNYISLINHPLSLMERLLAFLVC